MGESGNEARGWESLGMRLGMGESGNEARGGRAWE